MTRLLLVGGSDSPDLRKFTPSVRESGVLLGHESGWDTKTIGYYIKDPRTPVGRGDNLRRRDQSNPNLDKTNSAKSDKTKPSSLLQPSSRKP